MAETAIKERGEVNFPGTGGYVIRFRNSDLKRLEAQFDIGFFGAIIEAVMNNKGSFEMLDALLKEGAKKDGKPVTIPEEELDEIVLEDQWKVAVDGLCMSMRGKTLAQHFDEINKAIEEERNKLLAEGAQADPPIIPASSSTTSGDDATGPASDQTTSGT